jgi:hypothetical protein
MKLQPLDEIVKLLNENLGFYGTMISGSKTGYSLARPKNFAIFNANICTEKQKIWYGDIDLTLSKDKLVEISKTTDTDLYVFYEHDARFDKENDFELEKAAVVFYKDGTFKIRENLQKYYSL